MLDPGPDFPRRRRRPSRSLRHLDAVRRFGRPLLLALSRKDFLGAILLKPPRQRLAGTMAAVAHIAAVPGNIVRVHDVAATRDVLAVIDVLTGRADVAPDYELPMSLRREPFVIERVERWADDDGVVVGAVTHHRLRRAGRVYGHPPEPGLGPAQQPEQHLLRHRHELLEGPLPVDDHAEIGLDDGVGAEAVDGLGEHGDLDGVAGEHVERAQVGRPPGDLAARAAGRSGRGRAGTGSAAAGRRAR